MRRTLSAQQLSREEDQLVTFLAGLTSSMVRLISGPQKAFAPSGVRLRAFKLIPGLYLGRNLQFYKQEDGAPRVVALSLTETLQWISAKAIQERVVKALDDRRPT